MYHPGRSQPNTGLATLQRTFYPKHVSYFGNGSGRDQHIIMNNGGFTSQNKVGLGHQGIHQKRYNGINHTNSRSPSKEATTHYYQSDGTGRDSYVLMDNGGSRPEYARYNQSPDKLFTRSLRQIEKSPLKDIRSYNPADAADITTYLNWPSTKTRFKDKMVAKAQKEQINRLNSHNHSKSPNRINKITKTFGDQQFQYASIQEAQQDNQRINKNGLYKMISNQLKSGRQSDRNKGVRKDGFYTQGKQSLNQSLNISQDKDLNKTIDYDHVKKDKNMYITTVGNKFTQKRSSQVVEATNMLSKFRTNHSIEQFETSNANRFFKKRDISVQPTKTKSVNQVQLQQKHNKNILSQMQSQNQIQNVQRINNKSIFNENLVTSASDNIRTIGKANLKRRAAKPTEIDMKRMESLQTIQSTQAQTVSKTKFSVNHPVQSSMTNDRSSPARIQSQFLKDISSGNFKGTEMFSKNKYSSGMDINHHKLSQLSIDVLNKKPSYTQKNTTKTTPIGHKNIQLLRRQDILQKIKQANDQS